MENMASLVSDTKLAINSMSMSIRMMGQICYSVIAQANSEKEIPSAPIRSRT